MLSHTATLPGRVVAQPASSAAAYSASNGRVKRYGPREPRAGGKYGKVAVSLCINCGLP
jgi:hypothetical protein